MHADYFQNWASEVWSFMTAWMPDPQAEEKACKLIEELGDEGALAEAARGAIDLSLSIEDRALWKRVLYSVNQELWRRKLVF